MLKKVECQICCLFIALTLYFFFGKHIC
jgi:hypothetical protein